MERLGQRFTPHTLGLMVIELGKNGEWRGERRGLTITLTLAPQTEMDGDRIHWRARLRGHKAQRGRAGTVYEAIQQIEHAIRKAVPIPPREMPPV